MRAGDTVGGNWVTDVPRAGLAMQCRQPWRSASRGAELRIQQKQLDVYGIYELQALGGVLRTGGQNSSKWQ